MYEYRFCKVPIDNVNNSSKNFLQTKICMNFKSQKLFVLRKLINNKKEYVLRQKTSRP